MAEPSPTSGAKPLTEAEAKQRDELNARAAAAALAATEQNRKDQLAKLQPIADLLKLLRTEKITEALDTIIADPNIDFDTKSLVQSYRQSTEYNLGRLGEMVTRLSIPTTPIPVPTES